MEEEKSILQKMLEAEGWELLGNEDPNNHGTLLFGADTSSNDFEIRQAYLSRGFKDVKVTPAYALDGEELENMRAVYVKRK